MLHNKSILSKLTAACNVSVVKARANSEKSGLFSVLVAEREQERERESQKEWQIKSGFRHLGGHLVSSLISLASY